MRWADAIANSRTKRATRALKSPDDPFEPNVVLHDPKFDVKPFPKAFHVPEGERYGWKRVQLRHADDYDDWAPSDPINVIDAVAKLDEC